MTLQTHPSGNLLRRPTVLDPINHRLTDAREPRQLPQLGASFAGHVMRCYTVTAVEIRDDLVDEHVALDLPENRRAMAPKLLGDDANSQARHAPAGDLTPFIHVDVGVGAFHCSFLASDNPLVSFASRTSSLNPPGYIRLFDNLSYGTVAAKENHPAVA
jgi:hypothetical protein